MISSEDEEENLQIGETSEQSDEPSVGDTGPLPVEPTHMLVDSNVEIVLSSTRQYYTECFFILHKSLIENVYLIK